MATLDIDVLSPAKAEREVQCRRDLVTSSLGSATGWHDCFDALGTPADYFVARLADVAILCSWERRVDGRAALIPTRPPAAFATLARALIPKRESIGIVVPKPVLMLGGGPRHLTPPTINRGGTDDGHRT